MINESEKRFRLAVSQGPHSDLFISSDDYNELKLEAYKYLKKGHSCFIIDSETNTQIDLKLKD